MKKVFVLIFLVLPAVLFAQIPRPMSAYVGLAYSGGPRISSEVSLLPSSVPLNGGVRVDTDFSGKDKVFYPLFLRARFGVLTLDAGGGMDEAKNFSAFATGGLTLSFGTLSLSLRGGAAYRRGFVPLFELGLVVN